MSISYKNLALLSVAMVLLPSAALANTVPVSANPPASKCVTAATKASRDAYHARMEKDVAPYLQNTNAEKFVKAYRDGLVVDWDAMEEPYCGFGAYGAKSAIKSYTKSVERKRNTFLTAVKNLTKGTVVEKPVAVVEKKPVEKTAEKPVEKTVVKTQIPSGLRRGMRSEDVKALQKFLAARYKIAADDLVTGYFGPTTEKYLIKFQIETKVVANASTPGAGLFGPKTAQVVAQN